MSTLYGLPKSQFMFQLRRPSSGVHPQSFQLVCVVNGKKKEKLILGRHGSECDIFIFVEEQPNFLSRKHACIYIEREEESSAEPTFWIQDSQSVNGIYVNGNCLEEETRHNLKDKDCVVFGNPNHSFFVEYQFVVVTPESPIYKSLSLEALRLAKWKPAVKRKAGLSSLSSRNKLQGNRMRRLAKRRRFYFKLMDLDKDTSASIFGFLTLREVVRLRMVCKYFDNFTKAALRQIKAIRWCYGMGGILSECKTLQSIDSSGCFLMNDFNLKLVASQCGETLVHLNLNGCPSISSKGLNRIAIQCSNLEVLQLRGCKRVAPQENWTWLHQLVYRNTMLRVLDLRGCGLTDLALGRLGMFCDNLEEIHVGVLPSSDLSDAGLVAFAQGRPYKLRKLDLCGCSAVTDRGLIHIIQKHYRTLKSLGLQCCGITDVTLTLLGQLKCKIEHLNLHRCVSIQARGMAFFVRQCGSTLVSLDLSNCYVRDKVLKELGKHASGLKQIDLRSCKLISSQGIQRLVSGCPLLEEIDLDSCTNVCDVALTALSRLQNLKQVELARCPMITSEALDRFKLHSSAMVCS